MNTMNDAIIKSSNKKKNRWSKSTEANGITKRIEVRESDNNGYIINLSVYGDVPQKDGTTKWISKDKEIISKTNPLGSEDDEFTKSMNSLEEALGDSLNFEEV